MPSPSPYASFCTTARHLHLRIMFLLPSDRKLDFPYFAIFIVYYSIIDALGFLISFDSPNFKLFIILYLDFLIFSSASYKKILLFGVFFWCSKQPSIGCEEHAHGRCSKYIKLLLQQIRSAFAQPLCPVLISPSCLRQHMKLLLQQIRGALKSLCVLMSSLDALWQTFNISYFSHIIVLVYVLIFFSTLSSNKYRLDCLFNHMKLKYKKGI